MAKKLFNTNFDDISTEVLKEMRINIVMNFRYLKDSDGTVIYDHRKHMELYMHILANAGRSGILQSLKGTIWEQMTLGEMIYLDLICEIDARKYVIV